jgi:putative methionine-R-sulfoxide reductase with GAF domain
LRSAYDFQNRTRTLLRHGSKSGSASLWGYNLRPALSLDTRRQPSETPAIVPATSEIRVDRYSIFDGNAPAAAAPAPAKDPVGAPTANQLARSPSENHQRSLPAMAERDLQAALQLLAERAQYITGASGAMIALLENGHVICRASAGPAALQVGTQLQVEAGLTGESLRQKQLLHCDDAEQDPRVNREGCRALGVRSVMAMPLLRDGEVAGVFELLAARPQAFEERDAKALQRLSELALIALEHAEAARHTLHGAAARNEEWLPSQVAATVATPAAGEANPATQPVPQPPAESQPAPSGRLASTRQCKACGFPVSPERTLCLDCEAAQTREEDSALAAPTAAADFLSQLSAPLRKESWFERNMYTIGTIVVAALTVLALWLKFH